MTSERSALVPITSSQSCPNLTLKSDAEEAFKPFTMIDWRRFSCSRISRSSSRMMALYSLPAGWDAFGMTGADGSLGWARSCDWAGPAEEVGV